MIPSGGPFVFLCREGRMVIGAINKFVRGLPKQHSFTELTTKKVQGKVAKLKDTIYKHTLDIRAFTSCSIPPHLEHFLLAEDNAQATDLRACSGCREPLEAHGQNICTPTRVSTK